MTCLYFLRMLSKLVQWTQISISPWAVSTVSRDFLPSRYLERTKTNQKIIKVRTLLLHSPVGDIVCNQSAWLPQGLDLAICADGQHLVPPPGFEYKLVGNGMCPGACVRECQFFGVVLGPT